ncbi:cell envelope integrity protein TolA [Mesorhizobium sp. GbtcB19]|uniref:cell envelope integrity protein TolA n=1 Tax=Mesorhizobium sp. GbtcB19 TaxID=2824764 RepID=UPI001C2FAA01|nr:cell envelope integrity protein TolA [Mesorhizobium sp. GbtcB19]
MNFRHAMAALACAVFVNASCVEAWAQQRACGSRDPVNTIAAMFDAIYACWQPPPGTGGLSLTLRFSLRRDGTLIGKPRATVSKLGPDDGLNRAFVASVLEALDKALPVPFTDSMGGAIAGRMLSPLFAAADEGRS